MSSQGIEVFISYAHEDELLRSELNKHLRSLERESLIHIWHDRKISPGIEWEGEISSSLESADIILLLISSDFINSDYCNDVEMSRALQRHDAGEVQVIPIILRPCDWHFSSFSKLNCLPLDGRPISSWEDRDQAFTSVVKELRRVVSRQKTDHSNPSVPQLDFSLAAPTNLPRSGAVSFVGREEKLVELHNKIQLADRLAITAIEGMGGIGKTEIALQYAIAQSQAGRYSGGLFWIIARDREIATQILNFARENLGISLPDLDVIGQIRYCWQHWPEGEVLVIIDDVTDYESLVPYLPPSNPKFKLLITTRLNLGSTVEKVSISELSEKNSISLLKGLVGDKRIRSQIVEARVLCEWVGYLPLGLELAGRFLANDLDLSIKDLLEELKNIRLRSDALQEVEAGMTAKLGVTQALELSWLELDDIAKELAYLLGMFATAPIKWELVEQCLHNIAEKELKKARNKGLINRSLLKRVTKDYYQLHQIVQEFFRSKLAQGSDADEVKTSFCKTMIGIIKDMGDLPTLSKLDEVKDIITHLQEVGDCWIELLSDEDLICLLSGIGYFYERQGNYASAIPWSEKCLDLAKLKLGEGHAHISTRNERLSALYFAQGEYGKAEPLIHEVLEMKQHQLGAEHSDVADSLNALALLYYEQGRYKESESLFYRALGMKQRLLGDEHLDVATTFDGIGTLYYDQGKYEQAEPILRKALDIRKRLLGDEHLDVATSLNILAELYRSQSKYLESESLFREVLAMRKRLLGDEHPDVSTSLNNLALLYRDQGKYDRAENLFLETLSIDKKSLGEHHPYVATGLHNLALLYRDQGKYEKAETLFQDSLMMRKQLLGNEHPLVANSLDALALLYRDKGEYELAEPLFLESLAMYRHLLGAENPDVAISLNNLGGLYREKKAYKLAEPIFFESLAMSKKVLGEDHLNVAICLNDIAILYLCVGDYISAKEGFHNALAMKTKLLGQEHPSVVETIYYLAEVYKVMGDIEKAKDMFGQSLTIAKHMLGSDHPKTLRIQKSFNSLP